MRGWETLSGNYCTKSPDVKANKQNFEKLFLIKCFRGLLLTFLLSQLAFLRKSLYPSVHGWARMNGGCGGQVKMCRRTGTG